MAEIAELIAQIPLFALLDADERETLARALEPRRLGPGGRIFAQGDAGDALYIVRRGRVRLFVESDEGEAIELGEAGPGEYFGEVALLDGGPRAGTAEATEEADLLRLDRDDLLGLVARHPHAALDLLTVVGRRLRAADERLRHRGARNPNIEDLERLTFGQRIADRVAAFGGSWTFIIAFGAVLVGWMAINAILLATRAFDPYPFILLNLVLSTLAALQAPVIMMSQNRQSAKDRLKADLDFEVNVKAEMEVAHLHRKVDRIYEAMQAHFARPERRPGPTDPAPRPDEAGRPC